jgi:hypothetical protein
VLHLSAEEHEKLVNDDALLLEVHFMLGGAAMGVVKGVESK